MELAMKNGFNEMSQNEMELVDGGVAPVVAFLGGMAIGYIVDGVVQGVTGRSVGGWIAYTISGK